MLEVVAAVVTFLFIGLITLKLLWLRKSRNKRHIAFLHPDINKGGGEQVMLMAIVAVQKAFPNAEVSIYTSMSGLAKDDLYKRAKKVFGIELTKQIKVHGLLTAFLANSKTYPSFTRLLQALGMFVVGLECFIRHKPDLLIDTMGYAFAYPVFWFAGIPTIAYIHYPFICVDVIEQRRSHRIKLISMIIMLYYSFVIKLYSMCGRFLHFAMANSTWTYERISPLWNLGNNCQIVYPPCNFFHMINFGLDDREPIIFSLAQFRPKKNHLMQIRVLARLFELRPEWKGRVKLIMFGGCQDAEDRACANAVVELATNLDLEDSVSVVIDADNEEVSKMLGRATIGLHTMIDEHFGISIVEFMVAGPIVVANKSGGPLSDIVKSDAEGFLCSTEGEYAKTIEKVLAMPESSRREIRERARAAAISRFDAIIFEKNFLSFVSKFVSPLGKGTNN